MARQYHVEGTKNYLIWGWVLLALSIWHIVDGWIPQARWMGAQAEAEVRLAQIPVVIRAAEIGENFNDRSFHFIAVPATTEDIPVSEAEPILIRQTNHLHRVHILSGQASVADVVASIDALPRYLAFLPEGEEGAVPLDEAAVANQVAILGGGQDGKYPNFPEEWHDFSLQEFYAYNRWTGVMLAIASIVCFYIHKVVR